MWVAHSLWRYQVFLVRSGRVCLGVDRRELELVAQFRSYTTRHYIATPVSIRLNPCVDGFLLVFQTVLVTQVAAHYARQ